MGRGTVGEGLRVRGEGVGHGSGEKQGVGWYESVWERRECSMRCGCVGVEGGWCMGMENG
jgi:hypothetical protein